MEKFLVQQFLLDQGFDEQKQTQLRGAVDDWVHILATLKALQPRFTRLVAAIEMASETLKTKVT